MVSSKHPRNRKVAPEPMLLIFGIPTHDLSQIVCLSPAHTGSHPALETPELHRRMRDLLEILARVEANCG